VYVNHAEGQIESLLVQPVPTPATNLLAVEEAN